MFVYLVQHAEAKSEKEDPSRTLSARGDRDIKKVAGHISQFGISLYKIFHSSKVRAKQTADILSGHLKPAQGVSEVDGLAPLDDPGIWAKRLSDIPDDVMLVGHLPHLDKLVSLLLCGRAEKSVVSFKMAGVVCLKRGDTASYSVQWMITPDIVKE